MKSEKVLLSQLKVNEANPRRITDKKMRLLVERLLVFPKMIGIRPIVVDATMTALGGNMRLRAFDIISRMDINEIVQTVSRTKNYRRMDKGQQEELLRQWSVWLDRPTVEIVRASDLTDAEKREFIIADNASFGEWDFDRLGNEWDAEELNSWGLDVWAPDSGFEPAPQQTSSPAQPSIDGASLPAELQGIDITPEQLPKIEGDNQTAMERIIIVYPREREAELAAMIGLESIGKVVYNIDELNGSCE